jgi:UDP:flavonoid glycosyltransferase YjiC (YdhE family)
MVGHTTDFAREAAQPVDATLARWLALPGAAPVVYVGLGTLSVLPPATLLAFASAMRASTFCRFVWAVPAAQQAALAPADRACSEAWASGDAAAAAAPGCALLVGWAPQLALLTHPAVAAFWTHGGMNGVAEGSYARTPMLCSPLFSDQPDNCQRLDDRGMGLRLDPAALTPAAADAALHALTAGPSAARFRAAIDVAHTVGTTTRRQPRPRATRSP